MSILLPSSPGPRAAVPAFLDWGAVLSSPLGGADQKLNRLGDRFALDVTMPPIPSAEDGAAWVAAVIQGQKEGVLFPWPQGIDIAGAGALAVDGAGQAGTSLDVKGSTPGRTFARGQFFSVIHSGRRYLHILTAAATADGAGKASFSIEPMIRTAGYSNNAVIEIDEPMIEGFLEGNAREWTLDTAMFVGLQFRIKEAE
jgi:hypothetical protein